MIKKLLPSMIGAALVGGMSAASADVTVFGHIDEAILPWNVDLSYHNRYDTGEGIVSDHESDSADDVNLRCTTCSVGFKGSEDLGNGLKAVFKLDFQFDINNRNKGDESGSITDRDQYIGLAGNFGQVSVGTQSTVYKSHGAMIDPVYRTVVQARDVGLQSSLHSNAGEEGQGRAENTIRWDSADFNGLKLGVTYTLDSNEYDGYDGEQEDDNPYGLGASYENGGILVFADYLTNDSGGDYNNDLSAWKVGGKYAMDAFSVFGQYEDITNDNACLHDDAAMNLGMLTAVTGVSRDDIAGALQGEFEDVEDLADSLCYDNETTVWHIGGTYTMGSNTLYVAYGQSDADLTNSGYKVTDERDHFTIAGIHSMSKSTLLYAGYTMVDVNLADNAPLDSEMGRTSLDVEVDAFTAGIKHKF